MRRWLAFLCVAAVAVSAASPAAGEVDLSAVAQRAEDLLEVAEREHRRRYNAVLWAFGSPAAARALVPANPYGALIRALARPDRKGLADDFAKLRLAAAARGYDGAADASLRAAVAVSLDAGGAALDAAATDLAARINALVSSSDRARCATVLARGRGLAQRSASARSGGRLTVCATLGRRSAAAITRAEALLTRLLGNRGVSRWYAPLTGLGGALLSAWAEPGPTPSVYAVGADAQDGTGPLFLRMGAEGWVRVRVASTGTLWWVSGVAGQVYAAGTGGRVVRFDPATGGLTDLSIGVNTTLYGVWGSSPTDVWAVGGNVDGTDPPTALFHHDGTAWTPVAWPAAADGFTLFKVWGAAADDVWACGQSGVLLHFDGATWTGGPSAPFESLFTVHGVSPTIAVGGAVQSTIVERGTSGFLPVAVPAGSETLRGVFVPPQGDAWACGMVGTVLRRTSGQWRRVTGIPTVTGNDYHAVCVDDAGGVYVVGGDLLTLRNGTLLHFGPGTLPTTVLPQAKFSEKIAPLFSADHGVHRAWSCSVGGCHVAATPSADLDLFTDAHTMWTRLVDVPSTQSALLRVRPGRPSQSYLWHKLEGTHATVGGSGERMPYSGPYLSLDDMNAVRAWILEGARDN